MSSPHRQELLDFQMNDSNFMKMVRMTQSLARKLRNAKASLASANSTFKDLDSSVSEDQRTMWKTQEDVAQKNRLGNPSAMDIFDVQLEKGQYSQGTDG
jgi:hypothetical protein